MIPHLIVNPIAGNSRCGKIAARVIEKARAKLPGLTVSFTDYPGHATELAKQAVVDGATHVLCMGGDGTVFETATGLFGTDTILGIIPCGTGNDLVKTLGVPLDPYKAIEAMSQTKIRSIDVCTCNGRPFLNVAGAVFVVETLDATLVAKRLFRGLAAYIVGVISSIIKHKDVDMTITVDGKIEQHRALLVGVANGRFFGGGIEIAPRALPDDGLLDLIIIHPVPKWKILFLLSKVVVGKYLHFPFVQYRTCREVTISAPNLRINLDGEIFPMSTATFRAEAQSIRVMC